MFQAKLRRNEESYLQNRHKLILANQPRLPGPDEDQLASDVNTVNGTVSPKSKLVATPKSFAGSQRASTDALNV